MNCINIFKKKKMEEREAIPDPYTFVVFPYAVLEWASVKKALQSLTQPSQNLEDALRKLCDLHAAKLRSKKKESLANTPFFGLQKFFEHHAHPQEAEFLESTLPCIASLVLQGEELVPREGLKLSLQQQGGVTKLSRKLVASIVATGFLCLFPDVLEDEKPGPQMPHINFSYFFKNMKPSQIAKLKCLLHYFERIANLKRQNQDIQGDISFRRVVLSDEDKLNTEQLLNSTKLLCPLIVQIEGSIEKAGSNVLQLDFANEYLGGGVLNRGAVQEEIRFCICPELMSSMLFMERMAANEAVIISGFEQFSEYSGYADSLRFAGDYSDPSDRDADGNFLTTLCAIDAVPYAYIRGACQFEEVQYMRDINKAYAGFWQPYVKDRTATASKGIDPTGEDKSWAFKLDPLRVRAIATGNWGCGCFGGNTQFKALLQWIAASMSDCPAVIFYTFNDEKVGDLEIVAEMLLQRNYTVGELMKIVVEVSTKLLREIKKGEQSTEPLDIVKDKMKTQSDPK